MSARRKTFRCTRIALWQALLGLTVIAFLCRAIIPVGYMPETPSESGRSFAMTLCLGGGGTTVMQVSLSDDGAGTPDNAVSPDCPYGLCVGQSWLPERPSLALAGIVDFPLALPVAARNNALPPLPALGPPLGSRAPPLNLG